MSGPGLLTPVLRRKLSERSLVDLSRQSKYLVRFPSNPSLSDQTFSTLHTSSREQSAKPEHRRTKQISRNISTTGERRTRKPGFNVPTLNSLTNWSTLTVDKYLQLTLNI